jgi:Tol biopolymer transport system component
MRTDGSNLMPLTTATSSALPTGANDAPCFSPDGSLILFDSGRDIAVGDSGYVTNPTLRMLYTMKPDGSNAKRLTTNDPTHCSERNGRFSHDGQWVTFALTCDNTANANLDQVVRIKADGTGQAALVAPAMSGVGSASQEAPIFSSDDAKVFFVSDGGTASSQIYAADIASAAVTQITHLSSTAMLPGTPIETSKGLLYFATTVGPSGGSAPPSLQSIGVDGNNQHTLFAIPTLPGGASAPAQSDFALSPDEARLVFVALTSPTDGGGAVATSNLAGGDVRTLTTGLLYDATSPAWR